MDPPKIQSKLGFEYLNYLRKLREKWSDVPSLYIHFREMGYSVLVPRKELGVKTLWSTVTDKFKQINKIFNNEDGNNDQNNKFRRLHILSEQNKGLIKPNSLTLILAPPGHGKSTFLRGLAGGLGGDGQISQGSILYNGLTAQEALDRGVHVKRLCTYIGQNDLHFPTLTVLETLNFAAHNSNADIRLLEDESLTKDEARRASMVIDMLGLNECENTIIGNDLLRGVSGGQRKRVTVAEMILSNARIIMMDEPTTGLDAAVAFSLFGCLKEMASITKGSIVCALLQPSPELYELFDDLILMREGQIVYQGPRHNVKDWFKNHVGMEIPTDMDEAAFIVDYLLDPKGTFDQTIQRQIDRKNALANSASLHNRTLASMNNETIPEDEHKSSVPNDSPAVPVPRQITNSSLPVTEPVTVTFHLGSANQNANISVANNTNQNNYKNVEEEKESIELTSLVNEKIKFSNEQSKPTNSVNNNNDDYSKNGQSHPAFTTAELRSAFENSKYFHELEALMDNALQMTRDAQYDKLSDPELNKQYKLDTAAWSPFTLSQYGGAFPLSFWAHAKSNLSRQYKLISRNRTMVVPRIFQAFLMGFIYSTLFYQLALNDFQSKFGLMLYVIMFGAFANLTELPISAEAKNVVAKQLNGGFYPTASYMISCLVMNLPLIAIETTIFGTLMYWVANFTADAGRYFFFLFVMFTSANAMSVFFRSISYVASNPDIARQMDLPFIVLFVIFGGFLIAYSKIPIWLTWLYWISPFSWAVRSMAINEFGADRYDFIPTSSSSDSGTTSTDRAGWQYMDAFGTRHEWAFLWAGIGYLWFFFVIFAFVSIFFLSRAQPVQPLGTKRIFDEEEAEDNAIGIKSDESDGNLLKNQIGNNENNNNANSNNPNNNNNNNNKENDNSNTSNNALAIKVRAARENAMKSSLNALPFTPATLAWRGIHYSVFVGPKGETKKKLLNDINGYAKPGQLTALMGASGAGKTTLMDVIAGRKTVGIIEGEIFVNGFPKDPKTYGLISGYVEQNDIHVGTATVREALMFSATLRLPVTVTNEQRIDFVNEVMDLIGLTPIADRMIGDEALPGLSPGQLKLVTIGVELVSNPAILFLDEPTSGLDAPAAYRVMKAVRRIAGTGRTVVCTIHQPSQLLFEMFDRLLLLKSGGLEVYFGDLGKRSRILVDYFHKVIRDVNSSQQDPITHIQTLPVGQNPANWMLDVIGVVGDRGKVTDFSSVWLADPMRKREFELVNEAMLPAKGSSPLSIAASYPSQWSRYLAVQYRFFQSHWRNPPMNLTRAILMTINGLLLGIVYIQLDTSGFAGLTSLLAVIFLAISFPAAVSASSSSPALFRQRAVYYRETTIQMYGPLAYTASMGIVELPYIFFSIVVFFCLPFYFMVGLKNDGGTFFRFALCCFVQAIVNSSLAQLFIAALPNAIAANVVSGLFTSVFFMFGGLFKHPNVIPPGWKWFHYLDPVPKTFIAACMEQVYCDTSLCPSLVHANSTMIDVANQCCPVIHDFSSGANIYAYDYTTNILEFDIHAYWPMIGYLLLTVFGLRVLNLISLKKISHIKR